jgi:hypothetical protein
VVFEKNRIFSFGLTFQKYKKFSRHGHSEGKFFYLIVSSEPTHNKPLPTTADFNITCYYVQRSCHIITLCINSKAIRCAVCKGLFFHAPVCATFRLLRRWIILKDNIKNAYALLLFYFSYYLLKRFAVAPKGKQHGSIFING